MKYELIVVNKAPSKAGRLDKLLHKFEAESIEPHIWQFSSDKAFRDIVFKIVRELSSGFRYFVVALDGSEDNHIPNEYWTNDDYLEFCENRLKEKGESGFHTLRTTAQLNFGPQRGLPDSE